MLERPPTLPRRISRFDDPFYAFQRSNAKFPEIDFDPTFKVEPYTYPQLPMAVKPLEAFRPVDISDQIKRLNIESNPPKSTQQNQQEQLTNHSYSPVNYSRTERKALPAVPVSQLPVTGFKEYSVAPILNQPPSTANAKQSQDISYQRSEQKSEINASQPVPFQNSANSQFQSSPLQPPIIPAIRPSFHRSSSTDTLTKFAPPTLNIPPPPSSYPISFTPTQGNASGSDVSRREIMPRTTSKLAFTAPQIVAPPIVPPKSIRDDNKATFSVSSLYSSSIGVAGLKNLGNSCYLSSIVQCLSATIPLARYFLGIRNIL